MLDISQNRDAEHDKYIQNSPLPPSATDAGDHVTDDLTAAVPAKKLKRRNAALYTPGPDG
jgi:hypothetical protein